MGPPLDEYGSTPDEFHENYSFTPKEFLIFNSFPKEILDCYSCYRY